MEYRTDQIGENICSLIGNTPMVYLNKLTKDCVAKVGKTQIIKFFSNSSIFKINSPK